ncbi:hypothetical protein EYC80_008457 [Monilinia laxa]|uniref:alpha-L-rhamnosidase n=1 Tax=Monilinia laxa TaxID=61186 RepID=A0A5N6JQA1_MONLA|nr:hypothetical protein EYC80_008457 [Monilinia laxa]
MKIESCGIHGFHETLGIDTEVLLFHWKLESDFGGEKQVAYQITVQKELDSGEVIWDSGRCNGAQQRNVRCEPEGGFESCTYYVWQVTSWNQDGQSCHKSNSFFTAYPRSDHLPPLSMNQTYMPHTALIFRTWFEDMKNKWKPWWIGDGGDKPIYLRKTIDLERKPSRAIAFVCGLGHHQFRVNGKAVSDHVLDPGWTDYHTTVQYVAHDLTDRLSIGENVLGAHIGNGFYAGDQGDRFFWPKYEDNTYVRYGNELCFFAELHLFYEDGHHSVEISDNNWRVAPSATLLANIYASETHDRRLFPIGWDSPGFDDSSWKPAKGLTGPRGALKYQSQPPVVLHETFVPIKETSPRPGTICIDLGQNSSIMAEIEVEGQTGSEIIIRYGETTYEDGTICMPDPLFKEFETKVYSKFILAGTGSKEKWTPDFSFTSARYIQIDGVCAVRDTNSELPVLHSVCGKHISSASPRLGMMKTDKEDVNALLSALKWTFSSNLFSYHTDCPQIEKFAWLEVTHLLAPATQYMWNMEALYTKILDDILDAQERSGLVPTMAPEMRYMCGPLHDTITWGCALIFIPDILQRYYGTTRSIAKMYRAGERYMAYMKGKERHGGLIEHGLGDWGRGIAHGNAQANIETAIYHECLLCMSRFAKHLNLSEEEKSWKAEAKRIFDVYNRHLLKTDDQCHPHAFYTSRDNYPKHDCDAVCQAVALQFNMVPPEHIPDIQQAFLSDVSDGKIRAGEIGLRYLFNTLGDLGRSDLVLQMARQEEHPSYMRFLRRGETTLLEFWQDACRSKCHDMLGSILEWFYVCVLGLKVGEEGWRTFTVAPDYKGEFGNVEGEFESPYGTIRLIWSKENGAVEMNLSVPVGSKATVVLPSDVCSISLQRNCFEKQDMGRTGKNS